MGQFQYEWWSVRLLHPTGWMTWEFKAKDRDHVVQNILREVKDSNSAKNAQRPFWERKARILSVDWDSLTLDRKGYQRRW